MSSDPDDQVRQACGMMAGYVLEDAQLPQFQQWAKKAKLACTNASDVAELLWAATKDKLTFVIDQDNAREFAKTTGNEQALRAVQADDVVEVFTRPIDVELLYASSPVKVSGDCDDHSMYAACLAQALKGQGVPIEDIRFVCISDTADQVLCHVFLKLKAFGKDIAVDASHGPYPGWEADGVTRVEEFPLTSAETSLPVLLAGAALAIWFMKKDF